MEKQEKVIDQGYDSIVLRKLQLFEVDMLRDIDRICLEYGVRYFAIFGTAIGAIRHKGLYLGMMILI